MNKFVIEAKQYIEVEAETGAEASKFICDYILDCIKKLEKEHPNCATTATFTKVLEELKEKEDR